VEGEVKLEGPHADIDIDKPEGKKDAKFKIHMPKFGFGKGKADVDANLPSADVSIDQPKPPHVEGDIKASGPDVDIDVDKPVIKPDFDFSLDMPEFGIGSISPKAEVDAGTDIDVGLPKAKMSDGDVAVAGPHVDVDVDKPDLTAKGDDKFEVKWPSFVLGAGAPDADTKVGINTDVSGLAAGGGGLEAGVDVDKPDYDVRVKGDVPDADVNLNANVDAPSIQLDDHKKSKTKEKSGGGIKIDLPKFGFGKKSSADRDLEVGSATAYVDADVKQPSADVQLTTAHDVHVDVPSAHADTGVKVEKRGFGEKMKGIFSHKDPKVSYSATSPPVEGEARLDVHSGRLDHDVSGDVAGREMGVDVPSAGAELRLPSARVSTEANEEARSSSLEPDAGVRLRTRGFRPQSNIEGGARFDADQPRPEGLRTGSLERHTGTAHHPEYGVRLSWSLKKKSAKDKPKKNVEKALRMGLPIVSVAAGNFGDSRPSSESSPSSESRSTDEEKNVRVELANE